ncbi:MAG: M28 family peptidase, partial [bacterium]
LPLTLIFIGNLGQVIGADLPTFNPDSAWSNLIRQYQFGPRSPGSKGHSACRVWLIEELRRRGGEVFIQDFFHQGDGGERKVQLTNIVARWGTGGAPLMLAAHWDTRPWADKDPNPSQRDKPILGANDGASGVAVLLEVARLLNLHPPPRTIFIALWDGEDLGQEGHLDQYCLGSRYWVQNPMPEMPQEMILVDMVGDADLRLPWEFFSYRNAPQLCQKLWDRAQRLDLPAFKDEIGEAVYDDHIPFIEQKIPAINIVDFDYPYWHTTEDTPDKCSPESLTQVGRLLIHYIYQP